MVWITQLGFVCYSEDLDVPLGCRVREKNILMTFKTDFYKPFTKKFFYKTIFY